MRCYGQTVSKAYGTLLNLTEDHGTVAVLHLVEDGDTEGSFSITRLNGHIIEDIKEVGATVPTADGVAHLFNDVGSS